MDNIIRLLEFLIIANFALPVPFVATIQLHFVLFGIITLQNRATMRRVDAGPFVVDFLSSVQVLDPHVPFGGLAELDPLIDADILSILIFVAEQDGSTKRIIFVVHF